MSDKIFGIDLGTTYSCIAGIDEYGKPIIYKNSIGEKTTPSVLLFNGRDVSVGKDAKEEAAFSPEASASFFKRDISNVNFSFQYNGDNFKAEMLSAFVLKKLVKDASKELKEPIKKVVITCPAYFGINEREATKRAGILAGLEVVNLLNEPTAAAISYGMGTTNEQKNVLVYDLGGGTFDVTVISIGKAKIEVRATGGDSLLGGKDWDDALVGYFSEEIENTTGESKSNIMSDSVSVVELRIEAERVKRMLSDSQKCVARLSRPSGALRLEVSREKFEELTSCLVARTIDLTSDVLNDAGLSKGNIDEILLVGGSSRMPMITKAVEAFFERKVRIFNPDEAVAVGAALDANNKRLKNILEEKSGISVSGNGGLSVDNFDDNPTLGGALKEIAEEEGLTLSGLTEILSREVVNVCSKSFGETAIDSRTNTEKIFNIIKRNTPLPAVSTMDFKTMCDNQTAVESEIMENDTDDDVVDIEFGTKIGNLLIDGLPRGRPAGCPILTKFTINEQGLLEIESIDELSSKKVNVSIQTAHIASTDEMEIMKKIINKYNVL